MQTQTPDRAAFRCARALWARAGILRSAGQAPRRIGCAWLWALPILLAGCQPPLDTMYGQMSGIGMQSVNGTRVLADMFADAGHDVESRSTLSPKLMKADAIVWFPDDFQPPSSDVRDWLDDWLFSAPNRTLIYVGRDFDAAPGYWKKIAPRVAAADQQDAAKREAEATRDYQSERGKIPAKFTCEWFDILGPLDHRDVRALAGPWSEGIDAGKVEIELNGR